MRRFIVIGHRAVTTPTFKLQDIAGTGGRWDVLLRCIAASFCLSHGLRKDTELYLVCLGGEEAPKTVRLQGEHLKHVAPDERTLATLILKALEAPAPGLTWNASTPGISVAARGLEDLEEVVMKGTRYVLEEGGIDVAAVDVTPDGLGGDVAFFVGDPDGFTEEEVRKIRDDWGAVQVSLGPVGLHADHCIVLIHNWLDRARQG
ncbi:MAG TPA: tRNA (pseudouridine(54)-N(1))-methyltransferase TrmY [Candidatus Thermoplasmatota archaeon]|nr:tRNA (pseudouridine(54)-N(1))-methyltransferase TrmY [Candidatus Thermoplasmatota archaeon]